MAAYFKIYKAFDKVYVQLTDVHFYLWIFGFVISETGIEQILFLLDLMCHVLGNLLILQSPV